MQGLNSFDYAIVRVAPHVEREEFLNAGVIVFARPLGYLGAKVFLDQQRLAALAPDMAPADVQEYLDLMLGIVNGDPGAGPIAQLSPAERFHWLVAPRSTVIQTSPVHSGLCDDPEQMLQHLFETMVLLPAPPETHPPELH